MLVCRVLVHQPIPMMGMYEMQELISSVHLLCIQNASLKHAYIRKISWPHDI